MDIERILEIFAGLSGLPEDEVSPYRFLCEVSAEHIRRLCTDSGKENGGKAEFAAAALSYYRFILWSMTEGGMKEMKIGDVSVKNNETRLMYAERLYKEALAGLGKCLDEDFVFERTEK